MNIASSEAVSALHARTVGVLPETISYSIDTRTIRPGDTYLALVGENFDGHAFLAQAQAAGASAAIVSETADLPTSLPALVVENTHTALLQLAHTAREHFCGAVVAITGSAGKTTTKTFLAQILERARIGRIAATPKNENNEIGVSKVLLGLENEAAAVVEMGARNVGDIAPLVAIARPHVAILTNIGEAHIGIFGSHEALAQTKWQIFGTGARAVLSLHDESSRNRYATLGSEAFFCGLASDARLHDVSSLVYDDGALVLQYLHKEPLRAALANVPPGEHNLRNMLSACAAALLIGVPFETVARVAADLDMPQGRYQRLQTPFGATIIHDAYNASPSGTIATLQAFRQEPGRKIVVLGSMAELGDESQEAHRRVGRALAGVDAAAIFLGGEFASELEAGAREAGVSSVAIERFTDNAQVEARLRAILQSGDVVVVKGSRMYRLEQIIEALTAAVPTA